MQAKHQLSKENVMEAWCVYATWHHQDSSTTSHGLQSSFFSNLHLHFIFVAFSIHLAGLVPINRATQIL